MKPLHRLNDAELLALRFRDLPLDGFGTFLERAEGALFGELERCGISFRPHLWLSDEWFCPDGVPGFAAPFYLAHPRLRRLERKMMLEVEGGTPRTCLRLMRHETGHALDNAYGLRGRARRTRLFGDSGRPYPDFYAPEPYSRRYVRHLQEGYAQSHPDEDFAETFAVWLTPSSRWRERYAGWPALEKLLYVDSLMKEIRGAAPRLRNRRTPDSLDALELTLGEHYRIQQERYRVRFAEHYDADLERLFAKQGPRSAAEFLSSRRRFLRAHVASWTGIRRYTVDRVLRDWIDRARTAKLRARASDEELTRDVATALTVRVMQYLQSGHYRVAL